MSRKKHAGNSGRLLFVAEVDATCAPSQPDKNYEQLLNYTPSGSWCVFVKLDTFFRLSISFLGRNECVLGLGRRNNCVFRVSAYLKLKTNNTQFVPAY